MTHCAMTCVLCCDFIIYNQGKCIMSNVIDSYNRLIKKEYSWYKAGGAGYIGIR